MTVVTKVSEQAQKEAGTFCWVCVEPGTIFMACLPRLTEISISSVYVDAEEHFDALY